VGGVVPGYRVHFFKELLSSDGHVFNCLQQQVDVADAKNAELAIELAIRRLESLRDVPDWTLVADSFEVEATDPS
jgi:alpha-acetolactate decarboxylase